MAGEAWGVVPEALGPALASAVMLGLAVWILRLQSRSRIHQAFALFLLVRGLANMTEALFTQEGPRSLAAVLMPPLLLAIPFATLYFAGTYRARYRSQTMSSRALAAIVLGGVAVQVAYATRPERFWAWTPEGYPVPGILFVSLGAALLSYSLVGLMIGRDHFLGRSGAMQRSLLPVALGFALEPLFIGTDSFLRIVVLGQASWFGFPALGYARLSMQVLMVSAVPALLLLGLCFAHAVWAQDPTRKRPAARATALLSASLLSALLTGAVAWRSGPAAADQLAFAVDGLWVMALPVLAGFALARHQLFDLDIRAQRTVRQATVIGVFILGVGGAAIAADQVVDGELRWGAAAAAAGFSVLALPHIRAGAERVARLVVPSADEDSAHVYRRKLEVYAANLEEAWADGTLTSGEEAFLDRLRHGLGITAREHDLIEHLVKRRAGRGAGTTTLGPANLGSTRWSSR